jgi:hypothetical protein
MEKRSAGMKKAWKNPNSGLSSFSCKEKKSKALKFSIEKINKKYSFFSKIEEMRYDPDKYEEKNIQVHCKNHNCVNSKEKDGWFTPTYTQLSGRIKQLEGEKGIDGSYFYCSQKCKDVCPLYNLRSDPYKNTSKPYTPYEYNTFNTYILERDSNMCCYCGEHANIVHHLIPQKIEPFFALDPDYAISVCKKCHYKYGHQGECSTGNIAKIICNTESQKFLEQIGDKK